MSHFLKPTSNRRDFLIISTGLFLLVAFLFFKNLWLSDRGLPAVPVISSLLDSPLIVHTTLYYAALVSAFLTVFLGPKRKLMTVASLIFFTLLSCGFDFIRLQPAVYLSLAVLFLLLLDATWGCLQLIFILTYFWAGLQKLNYNFIYIGFEKLFQSFGLPPFLHHWMPVLAFLAALFEMSLAILLIFKKTRTVGVVLATFMHVFIILLLGPLGLNWDPFVWPWNIWTICSLWILFYRTDNRLIAGWPQNFQLSLVLLLFVAAPILNIFGWWNDYLSFKFFSSNTRGASIKFQPDSVWQSHPLFANAVVKEGRINVAQWAVTETGCPDFPSEWYYERLFLQICKKLNVPDADKTIHLNIFESPNRFDGSVERKEVYCSELTKTF